MTAKELCQKFASGEKLTHEEIVQFISELPPQTFRVRPLNEDAFRPETWECISEATEWCRLHALNNDFAAEIYVKARTGWRHVYTWQIIAYDPVARQIGTCLQPMDPLERKDLNE